MCSDRGTEEDESLKKTIECLRGRLAAERQQSKAAKESADQLSDKVSSFLSSFSVEFLIFICSHLWVSVVVYEEQRLII